MLQVFRERRGGLPGGRAGCGAERRVERLLQMEFLGPSMIALRGGSQRPSPRSRVWEKGSGSGGRGEVVCELPIQGHLGGFEWADEFGSWAGRDPSM